MHYTHLEDYINELFKILSIKSPEQLKIPNIANRLNLNIYYANASFRLGHDIVIKRSTPQKEWQIFGHEVGHYLRHYGHQINMYYLFRELQEWQASYFAYHFCVPTFMLDQLKGVTDYKIAALFNVEYGFALQRLEMYKNKFHGRMITNAM